MLCWMIGLLLILLGYLSHASKKRMRDAIANIPGPVALPLIGSVHKFYDLNQKNILSRGFDYAGNYGIILRIWALNRLIVFNGDLELNEQLLASQQHIVKQRNYRMLQQWLGNGLLLSDGRKWFNRRKVITPAFHFKILDEFVEVFDQQSNIFLGRLKEKADGGTAFDIYPFVCLLALDIITETAMGTKVYAQSDRGTEYAIAVNKLTKLMSWRFLRIHLSNEIVFSILHPRLKWQITKLIRSMHKFTRKVIEERRLTLEENLAKQKESNGIDNRGDDDHSIGTKKRMALLDVLLQSTIDGKPLSNDDIREEVDTFMFEGHDTTTSAISFAFHAIARHREVQQKLLEEILLVLGSDRKRPITLQDLNEMKYLECVIKETLRLYPSVPIIGRQLTEDFKYSHSKFGEGIIPAGTEFLIPIFAMMRRLQQFENPSDFIPERHRDTDPQNAFSFIPFSAGPRNCIGQKFAILEMKIIIAKTLREFELLPLGPSVELELNIVLRSSTGWHLGLRRRS